MREYIEYVKLHIISLEQDMAELQQQMIDCDEDYEDIVLEGILVLDGQIQASKHLLRIAEETLR